MVDNSVSGTMTTLNSLQRVLELFCLPAYLIEAAYLFSLAASEHGFC